MFVVFTSGAELLRVFQPGDFITLVAVEVLIHHQQQRELL